MFYVEVWDLVLALAISFALGIAGPVILIAYLVVRARV